MPSYDYMAIEANGREARGRLQAADSRAAAAALRLQGLFAIEINEAAGNAAGLAREIDFAFLSQWCSVPSQQMVFFYKQLTFMLRAGLPVLQALRLSHNQIGSVRLKQVIARLASDIENGQPLSQAMAAHPQVFPALAVSLVVAGENTGELAPILERIAIHLEKRAALKMQTLNAMIYPSIVVIASIGVMTFLVVKIIPAFAKFLAGKGRALPPSTQFLIDLSNFALTYGLYLIGLLLLLLVGVLLAYRTEPGRYKLDGLLLRIPVVGKLQTIGAMAQLNWSLAMMLRSGLTALDALKIAANVIGNRVISVKLRAAAELILAGRDLSSSLQHPRIPALVTQMIAVGERTGTLDHVLHELGSYYEESLQLGIKRLSSLLEPALILVIGSMVGFVYYSFFQAMFQLAKG